MNTTTVLTWREKLVCQILLMIGRAVSEDAKQREELYRLQLQINCGLGEGK